VTSTLAPTVLCPQNTNKTSVCHQFSSLWPKAPISEASNAPYPLAQGTIYLGLLSWASAPLLPPSERKGLGSHGHSTSPGPSPATFLLVFIVYSVLILKTVEFIYVPNSFTCSEVSGRACRYCLQAPWATPTESMWKEENTQAYRHTCARTCGKTFLELIASFYRWHCAPCKLTCHHHPTSEATLFRNRAVVNVARQGPP
jgi:hypothetical protein